MLHCGSLYCCFLRTMDHKVFIVCECMQGLSQKKIRTEVISVVDHEFPA